jgi:uncharacterized membrane protein YgaE (UPF0421/DUF939 family)
MGRNRRSATAFRVSLATYGGEYVSAWDHPAIVQSRRFIRRGWRRWRTRAWQIAQCAVGAAIAWWVSLTLLGHQQPVFAAVAAVLGLGISFEARLLRVGEVVAGVALGVGVGDAFIRFAGTGLWQIALAIAVAMSVAVLLHAGPMLISQAGVQAAMVSIVVPTTAAGLERWLDAAVGGGVALAVAAVAPTSPLLRPRRLAVELLDDITDVLRAAARSGRDRDMTRAVEALSKARRIQASVDELSDAVQEGLDVVRVSPFRRGHRPGLLGIRSIADPLARAAGNVRVLLRRIVLAIGQSEALPTALLDVIEQLSSICTVLAGDVAAERRSHVTIDLLDRVAQASAAVPKSSLSGDVVLAAARSVVVDLFRVTGLNFDEARARIPLAVSG